MRPRIVTIACWGNIIWTVLACAMPALMVYLLIRLFASDFLFAPIFIIFMIPVLLAFLVAPAALIASTWANWKPGRGNALHWLAFAVLLGFAGLVGSGATEDAATPLASIAVATVYATMAGWQLLFTVPEATAWSQTRILR